jgi:MazG family protein
LSAGDKFQRLVEIMAKLRGPQGCPWDRKQDFDSIKPYLLEETYEVLDAVDARDWKSLAEELGDLLLEAVFFTQMAEEDQRFSIEDSLDAINEKLVRRHPHIFGDGTARTAEEVKQRWDEIKAIERKENNKPEELLASVPRALPSLVEAAQISSRAAGAGFDWPNLDQVLDKFDEERKEFAEALAGGRPEEIEHEIGDLLFTIVNVARFRNVDPEQALRGTNRRFRERFGHVERRLKEQGKPLAEASLDEMEALWQEAKRK